MIHFDASYSPTPYRAVLEFDTESYWHFSNFTFDYIIPEHIFNDVDGIGYDGWNTWNPVFDPAEPHVTCGPYEFTDFEAGEFYELSRNDDYHYAPEITTTTTTTTTTITTIITTNPPPVVVSATGATYVAGTTGHMIYWNLYDDNPLLYMLYLDNLLNDTGTWDGDDITVNVDGHSPGNYNYTLYLIDYSGNFVVSTVFVNVFPPSSTSTNTTSDTTTVTTTSSTTSDTTTSGGFPLGSLTFLISIGSIGVIIVVVIVIIRSKS